MYCNWFFSRMKQCFTNIGTSAAPFRTEGSLPKLPTSDGYLVLSAVDICRGIIWSFLLSDKVRTTFVALILHIFNFIFPKRYYPPGFLCVFPTRTSWMKEARVFIWKIHIGVYHWNRNQRLALGLQMSERLSALKKFSVFNWKANYLRISELKSQQRFKNPKELTIISGLRKYQRYSRRFSLYTFLLVEECEEDFKCFSLIQRL